MVKLGISTSDEPFLAIQSNFDTIENESFFERIRFRYFDAKLIAVVVAEEAVGGGGLVGKNRGRRGR